MKKNTKNLPNNYKDLEYLKFNKTWHTEDSKYKSSLVIDAIKKNNIDFSAVVDLGCGAGLVTQLLAKHYPHKSFIGYEISPEAYYFVRQREKLKNLNFSNKNFFKSGKRCNLVICLDVFEHVEDYYGFLRSLKNKSNKFIFNIPLDMNAMKILTSGIEYARKEVGHLHYFSRYSALETLKDCGYNIKSESLSAAFLYTLPRNIRQAAVLPLRLLLVMFGKNLAAKVFG